MSFSMVMVNQPAEEPLTTSEVRTHIRADPNESDVYLSSLILVARQMAEERTRRFFISQTWKLVLDEFPTPSDKAILIPRPPLQSIDSIQYVDTDGNLQTLPTTDYSVFTESIPGRVAPKVGKSWPATQAVNEAVKIQFIAGYGATFSSIPEPIRQAMLMTIGHLYERREITSTGTPVNRVPFSAEWLLDPFVIPTFKVI